MDKNTPQERAEILKKTIKISDEEFVGKFILQTEFCVSTIENVEDDLECIDCITYIRAYNAYRELKSVRRCGGRFKVRENQGHAPHRPPSNPNICFPYVPNLIAHMSPGHKSQNNAQGPPVCSTRLSLCRERKFRRDI
ncbi:hypothetical protein GWI33_003083 [Rhynchophorus ferrugineus]|uniref:Uncharacterized protein n=1 Tax=Rhynchophorus ferrugineus TaxID=354439 RepID=A0A834IR60_RHYFE|nr:hypothetical protein GWI33_003083 [Rhynchophorus ferrugineus]